MHAPSRRAALFTLAALAASPALAQPKRKPVIGPLSADDKALVDQAAGFLQSLTQIKGRFTQTDNRGRVTQGDFFLKRPGKVRFAYDAPASLLVVSNGATVNILDNRLKTFESYPLKLTPLALFLAREIRLDRGVVISEVKRYADAYAITARDGKKEAEGQITLTFGTEPMSLRDWTVVDAQGQKTKVELTGLAPAPGLDPALFVLRDPRPGPGVAKR